MTCILCLKDHKKVSGYRSYQIPQYLTAEDNGSVRNLKNIAFARSVQRQ